MVGGIIVGWLAATMENEQSFFFLASSVNDFWHNVIFHTRTTVGSPKSRHSVHKGKKERLKLVFAVAYTHQKIS
jgi:hypothetical protein